MSMQQQVQEDPLITLLESREASPVEIDSGPSWFDSIRKSADRAWGKVRDGFRDAFYDDPLASRRTGLMTTRAEPLILESSGPSGRPEASTEALLGQSPPQPQPQQPPSPSFSVVTGSLDENAISRASSSSSLPPPDMSSSSASAIVVTTLRRQQPPPPSSSAATGGSTGSIDSVPSFHKPPVTTLSLASPPPPVVMYREATNTERTIMSLTQRSRVMMVNAFIIVVVVVVVLILTIHTLVMQLQMKS
jgi:hypothetical protein